MFWGLYDWSFHEFAIFCEANIFGNIFCPKLVHACRLVAYVTGSPNKGKQIIAKARQSNDFIHFLAIQKAIGSQYTHTLNQKKLTGSNNNHRGDWCTWWFQNVSMMRTFKLYMEF